VAMTLSVVLYSIAGEVEKRVRARYR
jgi:hypothetical protein